MDYKQQIEQKAERYIDNCPAVENCECSWQTVDHAFKAGAEAMREIANTWYDPKECLPELKVEVFCKVEITSPNRTTGGTSTEARYTTSWYQEDFFHSKDKYPFMVENGRDEYGRKIKVIGWKPITL